MGDSTSFDTIAKINANKYDYIFRFVRMIVYRAFSISMMFVVVVPLLKLTMFLYFASACVTLYNAMFVYIVW